jgi:hypothetical protein
MSRGLFVVGVAHGSHESATADAVAEALARAGAPPARVAAVALGPDAREAVHAHRATRAPRSIPPGSSPGCGRPLATALRSW